MLKTRVITAIVLLGVFIPALFLSPMMLWASLMMALTLVGLREWAGFLQLSTRQQQFYLMVSAMMGILLLYLLHQSGLHRFFYHALPVLFVAAIFWLVVVPLALFYHYFPQHKPLNMLLGLALMFSLWVALVTTQALNPMFLLVIISTIWLADSAAYFAGKTFGKHKLAPAISPGKTWEGVWGALVAVALYAALLKASGVVSTWWVLGCLWVVTIAGIYGDLFESFFKRRANLKDSGQFLPGHGGLLDRIDGVMPALPVGLCLVLGFHYVQQSYAF